MTIEAALTRELGIRFIDARCLATEARLREGIEGYPTEHQKAILLKTAMAIFEEKSGDERFAMKQLNDDLESVKSSHSHSVKRHDLDDNSDHSSSTIASQNSRGSTGDGIIKKVCSLGALRGRRRVSEKSTGERNAVFGLNGTHSSHGDMKDMVSKIRGKKAAVQIEGMPMRSPPPQARSSRVNRLGGILDIKVPTN